MPAAKQPTRTELSVSYSYGIKANMGQGTYENADIHVSKGERWNVAGMAAARVSHSRRWP